jgi:hypothetical protein
VKIVFKKNKKNKKKKTLNKKEKQIIVRMLTPATQLIDLIRFNDFFIKFFNTNIK